MKHIRKVFTLVLATIFAFALAAPAFAASITINRDSTYAGEEDEAGRTYNYYKIFSAVADEDFDGTAFDGGYDGNGTAVTEQGEGNVAYTATQAVAAKLADDGNIWFDVQDIAGSTDKVVTWKDGVNADADTVQAAAAWLIENEAYESGPTALNFADGKWTSGDIDDGYYVVQSDTGANLVAATTDIEINEKNDFPPVDKTQADEDAAEQGDAEAKVAIGDVLTYEVKVTIPKSAAVGNTIEVWDIPTSGLTYNNDVAVKQGTNTGNATIADGTIGTGEIWHKVITVVDGSQGTDVVFTFTMTVNSDALVDTGRENTSALKYGNNYESKPDKVNFTTYFTGIQKVDGDTDEELEGVKFTLKEDGVEFKVSKASGSNYYIPDANGSSEVVTDKDGLILIRGLDEDKTYTLTETETLPGYNKLATDVTLNLTEDKGTSFADTAIDSWTDIENNKGTVLPSTGGIGTTIFYVVGGVMVVGAAVMLVAKRRAASME